MARVTTVDPESLDSATRESLEPMREKWGSYITAHLIYARRPGILQGLLTMNDGLNDSGCIDAALGALVNRRVAAINGCFA